MPGVRLRVAVVPGLRRGRPHLPQHGLRELRRHGVVSCGDSIAEAGAVAPAASGKCPGVLERKLGSTLWGEMILMRATIVEVHGRLQELGDLNHASSMALHGWNQNLLSEARQRFKDCCGVVCEVCVKCLSSVCKVCAKCL